MCGSTVEFIAGRAMQGSCGVLPAPIALLDVLDGRRSGHLKVTHALRFLRLTL